MENKLKFAFFLSFFLMMVIVSTHSVFALTCERAIGPLNGCEKCYVNDKWLHDQQCWQDDPCGKKILSGNEAYQCTGGTYQRAAVFGCAHSVGSTYDDLIRIAYVSDPGVLSSPEAYTVYKSCEYGCKDGQCLAPPTPCSKLLSQSECTSSANKDRCEWCYTQNNCVDKGTCQPPGPMCTDMDWGKKIYTGARCYDSYGCKGILGCMDFCAATYTVREFYCSGGIPRA